MLKRRPPTHEVHLVMWSRAWRRLLVLLVCVQPLVVPVDRDPSGEGGASARCVARLNRARAQVGVAPVAHSATLRRAAQRHADYRAWAEAHGLHDPDAHLERRGDWRGGTFHPRRHFSGEQPWDRTRAAGLRPGTWLRQGENVLTGTPDTGDSGQGGAAAAGVTALLEAPYHRLPMLDAELGLVGCGLAAGNRAQVVQMVWPRAAGQLDRPPSGRSRPGRGTVERALSVYPPPGATGVRTGFDRASETPTPFAHVPLPADGGADVGPVLSVQAGGWETLRVAAGSGLRAVTPDPARVPVHWGLPGVDRHLPDNAAILAATVPLRPGVTYEARIVARVRGPGGWRSLTRTWRFTTAAGTG